MSKLVESILNEDYVSANELLEERLGEIMEQKLYENKRMMQAEVFGAGIAGVEKKKQLGYRKATDVLGDPTSARDKMSDKEKGAEATLGSMGRSAKKLGLPVDRSVRFKKSYVAGSDTESKARDLKARGSQAAAKWLKKTKTTRNVLGATKMVGKFLGRVVQGLGEDSE